MARKKPAKSLQRPKRNIAARFAVDQKAVVMKDKREGRGGARNTLKEDLTQKD